MKVAEIILDSSAALAFFTGEPGGADIPRYKSSLICAVNYAEIVGRLTDWGLDGASVDSTLKRIRFQIEPFDEYRALLAAHLRRDPSTRRLSLGDRACLSLALRSGLPVLTADRAWAELEVGVDVRLIR
jgi:PIN domain nuclease of toxin-antitoxin system